MNGGQSFKLWDAPGRHFGPTLRPAKQTLTVLLVPTVFVGERPVADL